MPILIIRADVFFCPIKWTDEKNLIIDLRNNGGDEEAFGRILFAHLVDKHFHYYQHLRIQQSVFDFTSNGLPPNFHRNLFN